MAAMNSTKLGQAAPAQAATATGRGPLPPAPMGAAPAAQPAVVGAQSGGARQSPLARPATITGGPLPGPAGNVLVGPTKLACAALKCAQLVTQEAAQQPQRERRKGAVDYGKSLVTQFRPNPRSAGLRGAATGGAIGAALAAVLTRLVTDKPELVGAGTALGGGAGAVIGGRVGREDAETEYTRMLALRRLGFNSPAELMAATRFPQTLERMLSNPRL